MFIGDSWLPAARAHRERHPQFPGEFWPKLPKHIEGHIVKSSPTITNLGKAVVNAFELKAFLTGHPIDPPRELMERYPELASVTSASRSGE